MTIVSEKGKMKISQFLMRGDYLGKEEKTCDC